MFKGPLLEVQDPNSFLVEAVGAPFLEIPLEIEVGRMETQRKLLIWGGSLDLDKPPHKLTLPPRGFLHV